MKRDTHNIVDAADRRSTVRGFFLANWWDQEREVPTLVAYEMDSHDDI